MSDAVCGGFGLAGVQVQEKREMRGGHGQNFVQIRSYFRSTGVDITKKKREACKPRVQRGNIGRRKLVVSVGSDEESEKD